MAIFIVIFTVFVDTLTLLESAPVKLRCQEWFFTNKQLGGSVWEKDMTEDYCFGQKGSAL